MVLLHATSPDVQLVYSINENHVEWYGMYSARWCDLVWALLMQRIVAEVSVAG